MVVDLSRVNANPPDHPNDGPTEIHVSRTDRTGRHGAQVLYHAKTARLNLTGIDPDNQDGLAASTRGNGETLVLSDTGPAGKTYTYTVLGTYDGSPVHTCDPQIHNEDDEDDEVTR
ncbi:MAG: hypothetical protein P8170_17525 [Gemmatimonadota bacterium]